MIKFTIEDIATPFAAISTEDVWAVIHAANPQELKRRLKYMKYSQFLRTPYWRVVSDRVKMRANCRCQLCNRDEKLVTHHRVYDFRGEDHLHMSELTCLCNGCHNKHHNIRAGQVPAGTVQFKQRSYGITKNDIAAHKREYPTFKDKRLIDWLNRTKQWMAFNTVADANRGMHKYQQGAA